MKHLLQALDTNIRGDALFQPGDLESLDLTVYEELLPLAVVRQVVSLKTDDPPGTENVTYDAYTLVGDVNRGVYNWAAGSNIQLVDQKITRKTRQVVSIVYGLQVNPHELRAARMLGKNVEAIKASAAAYQIARQENDMFFKGDTDTGLTGLLNFDATREVSGLTGGWDAAAGKTIVGDLRKSWNTIVSTDGISGNDLALVCHSGDRQNLAKFLDDTYPVKTVLEALQGFNFFPAGVFFTETMTDGKAVILSTNARHIQLSLPMNVQRMEPVVVAPNGAFQVNYEERTAGAIIRYAKAVAILTGL